MSPVFRFVLSLTAFLVSLSLCFRLHPSSCLSFWIQRVSHPIPRQISEIDKRQNFYRTHVAVLAPCTFPILHRTACSQAQCRPLHPSVFFLLHEHWSFVNRGTLYLDFRELETSRQYPCLHYHRDQVADEFLNNLGQEYRILLGSVGITTWEVGNNPNPQIVQTLKVRRYLADPETNQSQLESPFSDFSMAE